MSAVSLVPRTLRATSTRTASHRLSSILRLMSSLSSQATSRSFEHILTSRPDPAVQLITLNRPKALNALSTPLILELNQALDDAEANDEIAAVVLTGSKRAFAGMLTRPFCDAFSI